MKRSLARGVGCFFALPALAALAQTPTWVYDPNTNAMPNDAGQPFASPGYQTGPNAFRSLVDVGGGDMVLQIDTGPDGPSNGVYWENDAPNPNWAVSSATGYSVEWRVRMDPTTPTSQSAAAVFAGNANNWAFMRFYDSVVNPFNNQPYIVAEIQSADGNSGGVSHNVGNTFAWHTYRMDVKDIAGVPTAKLYVDNYHSPMIVKQLVANSGADALWFGDGTGINNGKYQVDHVKTWQSGAVGAPALPNAAVINHTLLSASYNGNMTSFGLDADYARGDRTAVGTGGIVSSPGHAGNGALDPITASGTVNYPTAGNFNADSGTVEMWVKPTNWSNGSYLGLFDVYEAGVCDIRIQKTNSDRLQAYSADLVGGSSWSITSDPISLTNDWHHVAWSWDENVNASYLYVDGQVVADLSKISISNLTGVDFLGTLAQTFEVGSIQGGSAAFDGLIDELRISDFDLYQGASFTPQNAPFTLQEWGVDAAGNWSTAANWTGNVVPDYVGATANLASKITTPRVVTVDGTRTVGILNFASSNSYTLAGPGTLTIDVNSGVGSINVASGNHTISAALVLADDTNVNVASASSTLTASNLQPTSAVITKDGTGKFAVNNLRATALAVNAGTVQVLANGGDAGASKLVAMSIAGGATPTAALDLNDNDLVDVTTGKANIEALVKYARNGGIWDRGGLTSSAARNNAAKTTGLGVLSGQEYSDVGGGPLFSGQTYGATDTLVKYTWNGDANFDGRITFDDYVKIDTGFNTHLTGWLNGDFNYSGGVNFDDYVLIDIAFNQQNGTLGRAIDWISGDDRSIAGLDSAGMGEVLGHLDQFGTAYGAAFLAAVPEPTSLAVLAAPALLGMFRRQRRSQHSNH